MVFDQVLTKDKRTQQEWILMVLAGTAAVGLVPFIVLRLSMGEWGNAIYDAILSLVFVSITLYVYITRKEKIPRLIFALILVFAMLIGFYLKGEEQIPWSYPGVVAIFFAVRPKLAAIFCMLCLVYFAVLLYPSVPSVRLTTYLVSLFFTCLFVYVFANLTMQQRKALVRLSRRDSLTNLRNRRAFDYKLEEFVGQPRDDQTACLILFDIDHFKKINDQYGHQVGDQLLVKMGEAVKQRIRKSDRIYRIGGEEFAIILARSSLESAVKVAENVRLLVQKTQLVEEGMVTISLGVAAYQTGESKLSWVERCDNALYLAKGAGRNQVKVAENTRPSESKSSNFSDHN